MFQNFLEEHSLSEYRFSSDIFPTVNDREFWNAFQNEECVALAESELEYSWPVIKATDYMEFKKSGNRDIMQKPHFDRRHHLTLFSLAELKENKGRFLPQIVNGLFAICEESFWGISAHYMRKDGSVDNIPTPTDPFIDLNAAETAELLAMVTFLLHDKLSDFCPKIIERVEYEIDYRIKKQYEERTDFHWLGHKRRPNNWLPWILSNVLTVFLVTEKDEIRLRTAIKKILLEIQKYYDAIPEDGGCDEGPIYWNHAGASLFQLLYLLKESTKGALDFFGDEKIKRIAAYLKKAHVIKDYFVNVADAHAGGHGSLAIMLFGYARETKQTDLMNFSAALYRERTEQTSPLNHTRLSSMRRFIYTSQFLMEMENYPVKYPLHGALECLPNMELAVIREGNWILSGKGGFNNESHNHNDVGSFTLYDDTTPVLIDVGIGTYTRFTFSLDTRYTMIPWTRSLYHNLPIVNDSEQKFGAEFRADRFEAESGKVEISYANAYPSEAGIKKLTRTLTLTEREMTSTDRFVFTDNAQKKITEVFMSILPVRIDGECVILGECYRVCANCGNVSTEFVPFEDARLESDWNASGVTRICFSSDNAETITVTVEKIK